KKRDNLDRLARAGQTPPPPENSDIPATEKDRTLFKTALGVFSYSWIELGKAERQHMGLDNAAEEDGGKVKEIQAKSEKTDVTEAERKTLSRGLAWLEAKDHRNKGEAWMASSALVWSRECQNANLSEEERRQKKYEYFVLSRAPQPGKEINGQYLASVAA